ncbi:hypothetical protein EYR38_009934 [Pleurotus pulmonarius]|nr:hypothetical protein EYR38_009934 [Pleurotus pulmonarius]
MPAARWTTDEEYEFLETYKGAYREAQTAGAAAQTIFWANFYEKWFLTFSIDDEDKRRKEVQRRRKKTGLNADDIGMPAASSLAVTDAKTRGDQIQLKRDQLKAWFRNNCRFDTRPKSANFVETLTQKLAKQNEHRTRARRPIEIYSKDEYCRSGTKATVDKRMIDEKPATIGPETKSEWKKRWITIYNEEIRLAWQSAPPELRKAVEEKALRLAREEKEVERAAQAERGDGDGEASDGTLTPAQVQEFIGQIPLLLAAVFGELRRKTGWAFTVLSGGPMPLANGVVHTH